jgi:hypothetical protein
VDQKKAVGSWGKKNYMTLLIVNGERKSEGKLCLK